MVLCNLNCIVLDSKLMVLLYRHLSSIYLVNFYYFLKRRENLSPLTSRKFSTFILGQIVRKRKALKPKKKHLTVTCIKHWYCDGYVITQIWSYEGDNMEYYIVWNIYIVYNWNSVLWLICWQLTTVTFILNFSSSGEAYSSSNNATNSNPTTYHPPSMGR